MKVGIPQVTENQSKSACGEGKRRFVKNSFNGAYLNSSSSHMRNKESGNKTEPWILNQASNLFFFAFPKKKK
jgi:hypothetical protein